MSEDKHIKPYMHHLKYYVTNCCMNELGWTKFDV